MSRTESPSTAMSTTLAVEYLSSKDTVTNTRLQCLAAIYGTITKGDSLPHLL